MARDRSPNFVIVLKYRKLEGPWLEYGTMNTHKIGYETLKTYLGFEAITAVVMKSLIFRDVTVYRVFYPGRCGALLLKSITRNT
jgi:hypothetical protein